MKSIAVFFGGESVEHDVSVITGVFTLNSLDREKFDPFPVYVDYGGGWYTGESLFDVENYKNLDLKKLKRITLACGSPVIYEIKSGKKIKPIITVACAINCMHGERGEDGALSGILSMCKIPFASPDIAASAICMDKRISKILLKGLAVRTLPAIKVVKPEVPKNVKYPVIVKPNKLGSSIGISVAKNDGELIAAINSALRFGESAVIEEKLENFTEINCAAYADGGGKIITSECEKPLGKNEVLTFEDKYSEGDREFPAKIDARVSKRVKKITGKIYSALNAKGFIRIDYFIVDGEVYVNEINTVPGSLSYYLFCDTAKDFGKLLSEQIEIACRGFARENTCIKKIKTNVLSVTGFKGAKRL